MEAKIQLRHPAGKTAVSMNKDKYDTMNKAIKNQLKIKGESSHTEILKAITGDFKKNKIKFEGSLEWHLEWVRLDMEARKQIKRTGDKSPVKFKLTR